MQGGERGTPSAAARASDLTPSRSHQSLPLTPFRAARFFIDSERAILAFRHTFLAPAPIQARSISAWTPTTMTHLAAGLECSFSWQRLPWEEHG